MAPARAARAALALLLVAACACVVVRLAGHGVEGQPNALLDQRMGAGRRSFRAALEEVPAGAGWAEVPRGTRPRGPGLRGLRASRLFAGAALYLDVNGNPMPGYYTGSVVRERGGDRETERKTERSRARERERERFHSAAFETPQQLRSSRGADSHTRGQATPRRERRHLSGWAFAVTLTATT